jgi:hypothetical protein
LHSCTLRKSTKLLVHSFKLCSPTSSHPNFSQVHALQQFIFHNHKINVLIRLFRCTLNHSPTTSGAHMLIFSHNSCITLALLQVCILQQFFCLKFTLYSNWSLHVQNWTQSLVTNNLPQISPLRRNSQTIAASFVLWEKVWSMRYHKA